MIVGASLNIVVEWLALVSIKNFNGFPKEIKDISSKRKTFKTALKHYLLSYSFCSLNEFFLAIIIF
jgi:hypothetical protein